MLIAFAKRLRETLRERDISGRLGGEEFAALLPDCKAYEAQLIAERIRAAFASTGVALDDGTFIYGTVSIGVAVHAAASLDLDKSLLDADTALYQAKHAGRDCVVVSGAPTGPDDEGNASSNRAA